MYVLVCMWLHGYMSMLMIGIYVCMYVCMCVCSYACMYVVMYVVMCVCMCMYVCVCMYLKLMQKTKRLMDQIFVAVGYGFTTMKQRSSCLHSNHLSPEAQNRFCVNCPNPSTFLLPRPVLNLENVHI